MSQTLSIADDRDVLRARQQGRTRARDLGFGRADQTRLATAISELTRNVLRYAGRGTCSFREEQLGTSRVRLMVVVEDEGPGIVDIEAAMRDGFSTGSGLGAGLPGAKRLVHEFDIESRPGYTRISIAMTRNPTRRR